MAITGSPETARLIRRAARMARRAKAELVGVNVRRDDGLRSRSDTAVDRNVALLTELGGRFVEVVSNDVAVALVAVARAENATQLVIGARRRTRVSELVRGSIVTRCVREARGDIDLHVIGVDASAPGLRTRRAWWSTPSGISQRRLVAGFVLGLIALPAMTAILTAGAVSASLAVALSAYLLVVIAVAAVGGILPGLLAALAAFLFSNYYFAPPIHTFTIANVRDVLALTAFLVAGLTVAMLVDLAARRSAQAARAERNARALARLVSTGEPGRRGPRGLPGRLRADLRAERRRPAPHASRQTDVHEVVAGTLTGPTVAVALDETHELVVAGGLEDPESQALLRGVASQIVTVLERQRLEREASERAQLRQADELRAALLAAVSHDLRTPLASIKTAATSLLSPSGALHPGAARRAAWSRSTTRPTACRG